MGPLAQMMTENGDTIERAIEEHGASAVAEFFVNVGTGIAMLYDITNAAPDNVSQIQEETQE